jgi:hypothetical protein
MPIYEEKLISPFAIRFTQEHIRTTFRDGRSLEAAIQEIRELPGVGDYDVVLQFPFPAIEIIRYCARKGAHATTSEVESGEYLETAAEGHHWFTLDNRRLYCLQRAAAELWPSRVAVAVEILYASPGSVKRKYDTTTCGHSVTISKSVKDAPLSRWDWRANVKPCGLLDDNVATHQALETIICDDAKTHVSDLLDVVADSTSAFTRALGLLNLSAVPCAGDEERESRDREILASIKHRPPTPSTADASDESDMGSTVATPRMLETRCSSPIIDTPHEQGGDCTDWYGNVDSDYAWWAIQEITRQLNTPGNNGYVWLLDWNKVYSPYLGNLRGFLESHPDQFAVIPGKGKGYRVSLVHQSWPCNRKWHSRATSQWQGRA